MTSLSSTTRARISTSSAISCSQPSTGSGCDTGPDAGLLSSSAPRLGGCSRDPALAERSDSGRSDRRNSQITRPRPPRLSVMIRKRRTILRRFYLVETLARIARKRRAVDPARYLPRCRTMPPSAVSNPERPNSLSRCGASVPRRGVRFPAARHRRHQRPLSGAKPPMVRGPRRSKSVLPQTDARWGCESPARLAARRSPSSGSECGAICTGQRMSRRVWVPPASLTARHHVGEKIEACAIFANAAFVWVRPAVYHGSPSHWHQHFTCG